MHSPAPWSILAESFTFSSLSRTILDSTGAEVAHCRPADAPLIRAAPALLNLAQQLAGIFGDVLPDSCIAAINGQRVELAGLIADAAALVKSVGRTS